MVTQSEIKDKLKTDPRWVARAIVALYERQTDAEKVGKHTEEDNGAGFSMIDAGIMSSFAEQMKSGKTLSARQLMVAHRVMPKYAGQLFRMQTIGEVMR